ncbi:MAG TPA: PilZ domain-containing protein [Vicinamibacterales bacterium]|nr:PilZ domain-containing protein [Vicinamibacterales bacterium]
MDGLLDPPLGTAEQHGGAPAGAADRRQGVRRRPIETPWRHARVRPGRDVLLIDIGPGGALLEAACRLLPGATVVLQLLGNRGARLVRGRVVRCEVGSIGPGGEVRYRGAVKFAESVEV